jgi:hypothetical protein
MFISLKTFADPQRGGALLLAAAAFAAGLASGTLLLPPAGEPAVASPPRSGHPADVLRGIGTPELHARCDDERVKALAAREALTRLLAEGAVGISGVGQDKYGGRVDADASTARTPDVSQALFAGGYARRYDGGRRESWCG